MESWVQSTFMGDIIFTEDVQVVVSMEVSDPATYAVTIDIGAGSWFASPLHLWQFACYVWNLNMLGGAGTMTATLVSDPTDANFGKLLVTPDSGWGTITDLDFTFPSSVYADLGLAAATWNLGPGGTPQYTANQIGCLFGPLWPLAEMVRAFDNLTGYSGRAADGTAYSVAGGGQETLALSVNIDRSDFVELDAWVSLFLDRWSRGRSVVFYLDRDDLPTAFSYSLDGGELLTLTESLNNLDFQRLVDHTETQDSSNSVKFGVRPDYTSAEVLA